MKKIIIDIDNTITIEDNKIPYSSKKPNKKVIDKIKEYKKLNFEIILFTSRNMRSFNGDISKINKITLPIILKWLDKNKVPYDGIVIGKPWCGTKGFYVDDKAIRPDEFINLNYNEIKKIIK